MPEHRGGPTSEPDAVLVDLALQGGGAHGAFTWGVLDRLLDEKRLRSEAISGTSAGAMNAAVLADGYAEGGREGARTALERASVPSPAPGRYGVAGLGISAHDAETRGCPTAQRSPGAVATPPGRIALRGG